MLRRLVAAWCVAALAAGEASAGVEVGPLSPRGIGHAGASLVSDDGAAAPFLCPAAIARRDQRRAQLVGVMRDDEAWLATGDRPRVGDGSGAGLTPLVGAQGHLGPLIVAASFAVTEAFDRRLPVPAAELPAADVLARYPHRYAGLAASWTRRTLAAAAAWRTTDWLALGASVTVAQVDVDERRHLWAGFAGRDPLAQPSRDVDLSLTASDGLVPGAALGALVAPLDAPLEVALGVAWADDVRADGEVVADARSEAPTVAAVAPRATLRVGSALTAGVGVRWLGERYAVEGAATWTTYPTGLDRWRVTGLELVDQSGARAAVDGLSTRLPHRGHGTVAAAIDVAITPGFAWLTVGYRFATAASPTLATTTVGAALGGHTLATGLELSVDGAVITVGVAHQLAVERAILAPGLPLDNPFSGGSAPANLGRHATSQDVIAIGLELTR